jgi:hypothetical protein
LGLLTLDLLVLLTLLTLLTLLALFEIRADGRGGGKHAPEKAGSAHAFHG